MKGVLGVIRSVRRRNRCTLSMCKEIRKESELGSERGCWL